MLLFIILSTVLFSIIIYLFILYRNNKEIIKTKNEELQDYKIKNESLFNYYNELKNNILDNKRYGYYADNVNLVEEENRKKNTIGDLYDANIYVIELDRYTNGTSKIKIDKIEIISGYKPGNYDYVKKVLTNKFSSIKDTKDIEWLESETSIKKKRIDKLTEIDKKINDENLVN